MHTCQTGVSLFLSLEHLMYKKEAAVPLVVIWSINRAGRLYPKLYPFLWVLPFADEGCSLRSNLWTLLLRLLWFGCLVLKGNLSSSSRRPDLDPQELLPSLLYSLLRAREKAQLRSLHTLHGWSTGCSLLHVIHCWYFLYQVLVKMREIHYPTQSNKYPKLVCSSGLGCWHTSGFRDSHSFYHCGWSCPQEGKSLAGTWLGQFRVSLPFFDSLQ